MPILYIDKPKGITSFAVCNKISKVVGTKKIGHTGTLDPNATGLMIVLYGNDTKANQFLVSDNKEYIGECKLGIETDTLDIDGKILRSNELKMPNKEEIIDCFNSFIGKYEQYPPMTSAIKINGKKLYEYQRNGEFVEVKPREVEIYELELLDLKEDTFTFRCKVSSGTYIRSLLKDILDKMNLFGTLLNLRRTKINNISVDMADKLEDVLNNNYHACDIYDVLKDRYYTYVVDDSKYIKDGKPLKLDLKEKQILIVDKNSNCLAIYGLEDNLYRSVRGLF